MGLIKCEEVDDPFADPLGEEPEPEPEPAPVVPVAAAKPAAKAAAPAPAPKSVGLFEDDENPAGLAVKKGSAFAGFDAAREEEEADSPITVRPVKPKANKDPLSFGGFDADDSKYEESALGHADGDDDADIFAADQHHLQFHEFLGGKSNKPDDMTPTPAVAPTTDGQTLEASLAALQTADEDDAFLDSLSKPKASKVKTVTVAEAKASKATPVDAGLFDDDLFSMGGTDTADAGDVGGGDFDFNSYIAQNSKGSGGGDGLFD